MRLLSKSAFLNALRCPALGWFERHDEGEEASAARQFLLEQGREIGRRARNLFEEGVQIEERDRDAALEATRDRLEAPSTHALFEAAFRVGDCVARADILCRQKSGWRLIEVKSGLDVRPEYDADLAYSMMVLSGAGVSIESAQLALVSREYRLGQTDAELFVFEDRTREASALAADFERIRPKVEKLTAGRQRPPTRWSRTCKNCPQFTEACLGQGIQHPILELPRLSKAKLAELTSAGVVSIEQVPDEFPLSASQVRIRECVQEARRYVGATLARDLDKVSWPALYLDFESVTTALPLYPGIPPYEQVPIQYSIHRCEEIGQIQDHREYLAEPHRDCRRELAERLLEDLAGTGSIVAYSAFEKTMIRSLARQFPDLEGGLLACCERLLDLLAVIRQHVYDPAFHGSYSLKVLLPVLVPDLSYEDLEIADGGSAVAAFARMAWGQCSPQEEERLRQALLLYCSRDTGAMVRLHQCLDGLAHA